MTRKHKTPDNKTTTERKSRPDNPIIGLFYLAMVVNAVVYFFWGRSAMWSETAGLAYTAGTLMLFFIYERVVAPFIERMIERYVESRALEIIAEREKTRSGRASSGERPEGPL